MGGPVGGGGWMGGRGGCFWAESGVGLGGGGGTPRIQRWGPHWVRDSRGVGDVQYMLRQGEGTEEKGQRIHKRGVRVVCVWGGGRGVRGVGEGVWGGGCSICYGRGCHR